MGPCVFSLALDEHSRHGFPTRQPVRLRLGVGSSCHHSPGGNVTTERLMGCRKISISPPKESFCSRGTTSWRTGVWLATVRPPLHSRFSGTTRTEPVGGPH